MSNESTRYAKFVVWSDEDQAYIGSCPGLFYGGCHGKDERDVFDQLCIIVDDWIEDLTNAGGPLPEPTNDVDLNSLFSKAG